MRIHQTPTDDELDTNDELDTQWAARPSLYFPFCRAVRTGEGNSDHRWAFSPCVRDKADRGSVVDGQRAWPSARFFKLKRN